MSRYHVPVTPTTWLLVVLSLSAAHAAAPIEILRDRWGVPHIYASSTEDLFYAQGYMAAKDRLFQLDLWRRQNTGHLAEVLGERAIPRDRIARLVRYRGNWDAEWNSYSPQAKLIATNFVAGINAYIRSLKGQRTAEFHIAGYDPGEWKPEDVTARIAGLLMTRNLSNEVRRAEDIRAFGLETVNRLLPPDPFIKIEIPKGLDLDLITRDILRDYTAAIATPRFDDVNEQGSNNWVVDGTMTLTGKPMLANDPHRPVILPSLRKSWHLVAPGWNVFGAGEPALPGVALGHNEHIAWGFTIVGIDQNDLYVERLNPANPNEYRYRGAWKPVEVERQKIGVKDKGEVEIELRYTQHGPIIHENRAKNVAYALKWVGAEPGGAGYLPALALMQAKNWEEFKKGVANYKVPSENLVYADTAGNIGWIAAGFSPVRKNWTGLLPVPGDSGEFEWDGFLPLSDHPQSYNPRQHFIATANHNILPEGYTKQLSYEWALPYRFQRVSSVLSSRGEWDRIGFERLQYDTLSIPAKRFQAALRNWKAPEGAQAVALKEVLAWDANLRADSRAALIFELWMAQLPAVLFGRDLGSRVNVETVLKTIETGGRDKELSHSLQFALAELGKLPPAEQVWGRLHTITFRHPLGKKEWNRGPYARPGDANTANAASGANFRQTAGASYRQIIDLSNWDRSVMTNVPGESGDPASKHYADLISDWAGGVYHPMPFSRKYVEASVSERMRLTRTDPRP
jgi:penicillin amidase